jgi:hypothetical protein
VEIWNTYEAAYLPEMALLALVLVAISALMTWMLIVRRVTYLA